MSVSDLKPLLQLFNKEVLKSVVDDPELHHQAKTIKTSAIICLNKKYDDAATDDLPNTASLVDPQVQDPLHQRCQG